MYENLKITKINIKRRKNKLSYIRRDTVEKFFQNWYGKNFKVRLYKSSQSNIKKIASKRFGLTYEPGIPDFFYIDRFGKGLVLLELKKIPHDGLRYSQLEWIRGHPEFPVIAVFLELTN